ncbi:MAG TPA: hypothetical protein PKJ14_04125 [Candidatus Cloacimonadota bacterium]|nr:hypothetical protein [Candidatus Cloacimonadota bacterium]HQL15653.1 hypothetical protein [Candidatus Cloacimonadota bacterium]
MKKYLFVLLLIVSAGILLAVESAPSETVGYVKYSCLVGDNLVAMPMNDGSTVVSEEMLAYNGNDDINTVNIWDQVGQNWLANVNYGGNYFEPDMNVGPGSVLFFNTYSAFSFYSIGAMPTTNAQYNIVCGDNTIMVPLNYSSLTLVSEVSASIDPNDAINTINLWDNAGQIWLANVNYGGNYFEPDMSVTIGMPLFLNSSSSAPITWPSGPRGSVRSSASRSK